MEAHGQNVSGQNVSGQNVSAQNVSATKHNGVKTYRRQNVLLDNTNQRQNASQTVINKIETFLDEDSISMSKCSCPCSCPCLCPCPYLYPCPCCVHAYVPVLDCDMKTVWCSTCDGVPLKFNRKMLKIISSFSMICRYVLSADTYCPPIRFVADTFCPLIRFVSKRFVSNTFCSRYVL